eukprot:123873-Rhodomonas_salina.1
MYSLCTTDPAEYRLAASVLAAAVQIYSSRPPPGPRSHFLELRFAWGERTPGPRARSREPGRKTHVISTKTHVISTSDCNGSNIAEQPTTGWMLSQKRRPGEEKTAFPVQSGTETEGIGS